MSDSECLDTYVWSLSETSIYACSKASLASCASRVESPVVAKACLEARICASQAAASSLRQEEVDQVLYSLGLSLSS